MFVFVLQVLCKIYFLTAGKNYYGYVSNGPSSFVYLWIYFLEKLYKGNDLIVNHTILYPFLYAAYTNVW